MDDNTRREAKRLLLQSRIYRFIAFCFAVIGVCVFSYVYFSHIEGDFFNALRLPHLILFMIIPFLPAIVLSHVAHKSDLKLREIIEGIGRGSEQDKNKGR